jgi:long-chain fatty acid transport protein
MNKRQLSIFMACAVLLFIPSTVWAAGFGYYEHGAKATAMGGAFVARADDASAVFYNPAGIAFLEGNYITGGVHPVKPSFKATYLGNTTEGTTGWLPPVSAFFTGRINEKISYGFGFFVPFGLQTDWPQQWVGNTLAVRSRINSMYFQPTLAYKISDNAAVGFGLDIVRSTVEFNRMTPPVTILNVTIPNIGAEMEGSGFGYGFNLGALFKVNPQFQIGLSYKSKVSIDYEGTVDFSTPIIGVAALDAVLGGLFMDQSIKTTIDMPQIFVAGIMYRPSEKTSFQADIQWTGWSSFKKLAVEFNNAALNFSDPADWKDSLMFRIGGEYLISQRMALRGGYVRDQTPIPDGTLKPILPCASRNELTAGIGLLDRRGRGSIDVAVQQIWFEERTSTYPLFPATYNSSALILGVTFSYKF